MLSCGLGGQVLVKDPAQAAALAAEFESRPSGQSSGQSSGPSLGQRMSCRITLHLHTESTFGVRAEYEIESPSDEYPAWRRSWSTLARVVPQDQPNRVAYFVDTRAGSETLLQSPEFGVNLHLGSVTRPSWGGWFWTGNGRYAVDLLALDDRGRICRKEFHVNAESGLKLSLPPGTVADMSPGVLKEQLAHDPRRHLKRLTLLLDAAPAWFTTQDYPSKLRDVDRRALLESVLAVLGEIPADSVRLICFSLDQQSTVFRDEDFHLGSFDRLGDALLRVDFGTIDSRVAARRRGHLDLLAQLINGEAHASPPAEAVIFLGPQERFRDAIPAEELDLGGAAPRFFYVRQLVGPAGVRRTGSIAQALNTLHGRILDFSDPETLIRAVDRIREDVLPSAVRSPEPSAPR